MDKLDIEIPGKINTQWGSNRIETKDFIYSPYGSGAHYLALAQRVSTNPSNVDVYGISIAPNDPQKIQCYFYPSGSGTSIQKKLCEELNASGTL